MTQKHKKQGVMMLQNPVHIPNTRADILKASQKLFRRKVIIEERVYQALELVNPQRSAPKLIDAWFSLSLTLPAINQLYASLGIDLHELTTLFSSYKGVTTKVDNHDKQQINRWNDILRQIFSEQDNRLRKRFRLTEVADTIWNEGIIAPKHVALGIIRARWYSEFYKDMVANPVLRHLAKASGLESPLKWSDEIETFSQKAFDIFQDISALDSSCGAQQFVLHHDGTKYRIAPFGVFGAYQLSESPLPDGSLWIARGNIIQPPKRFTEEGVAHLEDLINSQASEIDFQRFFELHPEFLLCLDNYTRIHPQVVIHADTGNKLIPDFFLEKLNSDFCDICDLKKPTVELVRRQKNRIRFRDSVMEAVAQLNHYRDYFDDGFNRGLFNQRYGLKAYRPKVVMIIGRRHSFYNEMERIRLESNELPSWVKLQTYDDVLDRAKQWRNLYLDP